MWFKEGQPPPSLATRCESRKRKKADSYEENVEKEYDIEKSKSLKSWKSPLHKKKNYKKNQGKVNFLFTDKNDDIDSHSNGDQADTVKGMVRIIFWIL